jgi:hydrogenase maturation protease
VEIYVIAVGNSFASDDGVGLEVVHQLQAAYRQARAKQAVLASGEPPVKFRTLHQMPAHLLDFVGRCDHLILVDAVSSGAPPGTVHREVWQPGLLVSRGNERASSHGLGLGEVLDLAAALGRLKAQVELWAIEVGSIEPGHHLSPVVQTAVPGIVDRLLGELLAYLTSPGVATRRSPDKF